MTIRELLDDYYHEQRSAEHKEEVVTFIQNYWPQIQDTMVKGDGDDEESEDTYERIIESTDDHR